jgi:hypothetical protein
MRTIAVTFLVFFYQLAGAYVTSMAGGRIEVYFEITPAVILDDDGTSQTHYFTLEIPIRQGISQATWDDITETFTLTGLDVELESTTAQVIVSDYVEEWGGGGYVEHLISFSTEEEKLVWDFSVPFPLGQKWSTDGYYLWEWPDSNNLGGYGYDIEAVAENWFDGLIRILISGDTHEAEFEENLPAVEQFGIRRLGLDDPTTFGFIYTEFQPWLKGDGFITQSFQQVYTSPGRPMPPPDSLHTFEIRFQGITDSLWVSLTQPDLRVKFRWMELRFPENNLWAEPYGTELPSRNNTITIPLLGTISLVTAPWFMSDALNQWVFCPEQSFEKGFWMFIPREK